MKQRRAPRGGVCANLTAEAGTPSAGVGATGRWTTLAAVSAPTVTSGALHAAVRACYLIPRVLGRQETDMKGARREDDESGRVEWVDGRGKRLGVERPFKRLLQNQFS